MAFATAFAFGGLDCALTVCSLQVGRARPVSTPSDRQSAWLGVVIARGAEEFAEFERIPIGVSVRSAPVGKSAVSTDSTIIPMDTRPSTAAA
jgi:hypothetical protein